MGGVFAKNAALCTAANFCGFKARARIEPARQRSVPEQARRLARQVSENGLGHVLGRRPVAIHLTQRGGIDQPEVSPDQFGERRFGSVPHLLSQQFIVVRSHSSQ